MTRGIAQMRILTQVAALRSPEFWENYRQLPADVRELADKNFKLLKQDSHHPSLRFKKIGIFWSARVGIRYRALAKERDEGLVWFWIGHHSEYEQYLKT
jgi:hypothetical protein